MGKRAGYPAADKIIKTGNPARMRQHTSIASPGDVGFRDKKKRADVEDCLCHSINRVA